MTIKAVRTKHKILSNAPSQWRDEFFRASRGHCLFRILSLLPVCVFSPSLGFQHLRQNPLPITKEWFCSNGSGRLISPQVCGMFFSLLLIFYFYFLLSHTLRCCPGEFWFIRPGRAADAHHTWMPVPWRCSMWALIVCILLMIFFWWPTKEIPKLITSLKQKHNVHKSQQWSMKRSRGISLPKQKETEKRPY